MGLTKLEQLLASPDSEPFYDLIGGLADNVRTLGGAASGTFLACNECGAEFNFQKPKETDRTTNPATKPDHWYYTWENWSVAEFLTQILRLQPENFLGRWFRHLGIGIDEPPILETVLCWPRFSFGGKNKTIQPDLAVGFERDIVLVEFKRPKGRATPPVEVLGQLCFAAEAGRQLGRRWHVVIVPGPDKSAHTPADYIRGALAVVETTEAKSAIPSAALAEILAAQPPELAGRLRVLGWESLLRLSLEAIHERVPESWTKQQALTKLQYFHATRFRA